MSNAATPKNPAGVRVGDTIRREVPARAEFVHNLLAHFGRIGWPGAPRFRGIDAEGRQILSYLEGHVARDAAQPPAVWSQGSLIRVARLVRQLHDLTAGTALAGDAEVVCHNALAPGNTVYRESEGILVPYAFIGWDHAAPGRRIQDIAHLCWRFLGLGPDRSNTTAVGAMMRVICDGYGLVRKERAELIDTIIWWLDRYIDDDRIQRTAIWVEKGRSDLDAALA